jgi:hypothetical protein
VRDDLANFDTLEFNCEAINHRRDLTCRLLGGVFGVEDHHRDPGVVLPRPLASPESRHLRDARDDVFI